MLPAFLGLPDPPWIVAHRGASADAPENTLASVLTAIEQGAHMVEIDVQLSADDELLLIHDWALEIDGQRHIVEQTAAHELRALVDGEASGVDGAGGDRDESTPLPTLTELLAAIPEEIPLNLELKHRRAGVERWCERLPGVLGERPHLLISSFDWELLEALRHDRPGLHLAPIGSRRPHKLLRAAETLGAASVHCHRRLAFADFISAAGASDWPVLVYTVNDPHLARSLFERGAAGVFTDAPGELLSVLDLE